MANLPDEVYTGIKLAVENLKMETGSWSSLKKVFKNGEEYVVRVKAVMQSAHGDPKLIDIRIRRKSLS